jgi:hypothetical protein
VTTRRSSLLGYSRSNCTGCGGSWGIVRLIDDLGGALAGDGGQLLNVPSSIRGVDSDGSRFAVRPDLVLRGEPRQLVHRDGHLREPVPRRMRDGPPVGRGRQRAVHHGRLDDVGADLGLRLQHQLGRLVQLHGAGDDAVDVLDVHADARLRHRARSLRRQLRRARAARLHRRFCGYDSRVSINATFGTTYYLRVGGYNGAFGSFDVEVQPGTGLGSIARTVHGCGPTTFDTTGQPRIGGALTTTLGNVTGFPLIGLGLDTMVVTIG